MHCSHKHFTLLPSGKRYGSIRPLTARLCSSFFPQAIRQLNSGTGLTHNHTQSIDSTTSEILSSCLNYYFFAQLLFALLHCTLIRTLPLCLTIMMFNIAHCTLAMFARLHIFHFVVLCCVTHLHIF